MPITPPFIRGEFYSTNLYARCPEFHQCRRCLQCNHYNRYNSLCQVCEARKPGGMHCRCTDLQQAAIVRLEALMNRPAFDPNAEPSEVIVGQTALDPSNQLMARELAENE